MKPRLERLPKRDIDRFRVAVKRPSLRIHPSEGGFLPVLLYWGRGKAEWYRYMKPLPTAEEARLVGKKEMRVMRRWPTHYHKWEGDPWRKFDGVVPP